VSKYSLSEDIENKLKKRFPNIPIKQIVDEIFDEIVKKTVTDGACSIRQLGKFVSYKTKSSKTLQDVVRFKFRISPTFDKCLKTDDYHLMNLPVRTKVPFNEQHEEVCKDKRNIRDANIEAQRESERLGKINTNKNIIIDEVENILEEDRKNKKEAGLGTIPR